MLVSSSAFAEINPASDMAPRHSMEMFTDFDTTDKVLLGASFFLGAIDMGQTLHISESCHTDGKYFETSAALGKCPEKHQVYQYFAESALITYAIAKILPSDYRKAWLTGTIIYEFTYVDHNFQMGVGVDF